MDKAKAIKTLLARVEEKAAETERMFQVLVPRKGKKGLLYPKTTAKKAMKLMETMVKRGFVPVAFTCANKVSEQLTLEEMQDIYKDM